jgi:hypothetical protein
MLKLHAGAVLRGAAAAAEPAHCKVCKLAYACAQGLSYEARLLLWSLIDNNIRVLSAFLRSNLEDISSPRVADPGLWSSILVRGRAKTGTPLIWHLGNRLIWHHGTRLTWHPGNRLIWH